MSMIYKIRQQIRILICVLLSIVTLLLSGCIGQDEENKIVLATTPWVGYYPLYYAEEIGLDSQMGVDLRIIENLSISDFRRAVVKNHVDGFAASMSEVTQLNQILEQPLDLVLFPDYSNGADVIVANKNIQSLKDLLGKPIGFEWQALSHYVVHIAFDSIGIAKPQVEHVVVEQVNAEAMLASGEIQALVTYPPLSTQLLKSGNLHVVFNSSSTPYKIIDVIMLKSDRDPKKKRDLRLLWEAAMNQINANPSAYLAFLAEQLGTDMKMAEQELKGLELLNWRQQAHLHEQPEKVKKLLKLACELTQNTALRCLRDLELIQFDETQS